MSDFVKITPSVGIQGATNSPFRSARDEDGKAELGGDKVFPDGSQQFYLAVLTLALIQAVDENRVWKGSKVPACVSLKVLHRTNEQTVHLSSQ